MNIEAVRNLQSFPNTKELNLRVRGFLFHHKPKLSEGTLAVLRYIWRHSVKYPGVSFAKVETIQNKTNKSRSTVIRAINCLVNKQLLTRVPTVRPNGKRGVNILVFRADAEERLPENEIKGEAAAAPQAPAHKDVSSSPADNPLRKAEEKQSETHSEKNAPVMNTEYLPSYIPETFIEVARPFSSPKEVLSAWQSVQRAYSKVNLKQPVDMYIERINKTFKQAVFAKHHRLIRKTFLGYFYGSLKETFTQIVREEVMADPSNLYYDWLNEDA
ncbi:helix-turn-helix domain-containing protein [Halobacillus shinanisalinarum]|uniref:Helix-turn-helix domain-containing protein n=1 Tax=Halobacillus shinanisalinarum TaxID=2932258 RepID=A0ABY4GZ54_9BACI|nr:helix-turn-helix domain-containing protein [Halobacillus shinanisalinarum]UOQ93164.1 helix-turn-helix domain-containing protein [Halobacillus shinanisalinarum]